MSKGSPHIITIASGKGGTGKTLLLASLGFALQKAGHKVLFVDMDVATEGLSHFILGDEGVRTIGSFGKTNTVSGFILSGQNQKFTKVAPRSINRGVKDDHGVIYDVILSGRGLYGDEIDDVHDEDLTRGHADRNLRGILRRFFKEIRNLKYDYVLMDTRGGFGVLTTYVSALSDSYILVSEPTSASLYQNRKLQDRILMECGDSGPVPMLRGVIVNKAIRDIEPKLSPDGHKLIYDPDVVERRFRADISQELAIDIADTYAIPSDLAAVETYALQQIPFTHSPGSIFTLSSMDAFSGLMGVVTAPWSTQQLGAWNELADAVKNHTLEAIQVETENITKRINLAAKTKIRRNSIIVACLVALFVIPILSSLYSLGLLPDSFASLISNLFGGGYFGE